ncbi:MAG TPA: hypothetical protein VGI45_24825 [Terracidiphilus sp.]|jgi:hypothetical protein
MEFAPRNQIARNRDVIAAVTSLNPQLTSAHRFFAAFPYVAQNFPAVFDQHGNILYAD